MLAIQSDAAASYFSGVPSHGSSLSDIRSPQATTRKQRGFDLSMFNCTDRPACPTAPSRRRETLSYATC
jgi:hypothetical protein